MIKTRKTNKFFAILLAFVMVLGMIPAMATTARADGETYSVTISPVEHAELVTTNAMQQPLPGPFAEGKMVWVVLRPNAAEGYYYDTTAGAIITVKDKNGTEIAVTASGASEQIGNWFFTMPASDVTVTFPNDAIKRYPEKNISVDASIKDLVTIDKTSARKGDTISVTKTSNVPEKESLLYIKVTEPDGRYYYYYNGNGAFIWDGSRDTITFEMPNDDVEITSAFTGELWTDEGNYDATLYASDPGDWNLYDAADLAAFVKKHRDDPTGFSGTTISIMNDIDLSEHLWVAFSSTLGNGYTLDGKGNTVSGVTINGDSLVIFPGGPACKDITVTGTYDLHIPAKKTNQLSLGLAVKAQHGNSIYENVTIDLDITVDGYLKQTPRSGSTISLFGPIQGMKNCAAYGSITVENINLNGLWINALGNNTLSKELGTVVANNYSMVDVTVADTVEDSGMNNGWISGCFAHLTSDLAANNYYGGTIAVADGNTTKRAGVKANAFLPDTNRSANPNIVVENNFSVGIDPINEFVTTHTDGFERIDNTATLLQRLNKWVEDNQTDETAYKEWELDGKTGYPVFKEGSDPVGETYIITKMPGEHISIGGASSSTAGNEITFSVEADAGYSVNTDSIKVYLTENTSRSIQLYENDDGSYSFYMPAAPVTIEASAENATYNITNDAGTGGSATIRSGKLNSDVKGEVGETIEVTLVPNTVGKYSVSGVSVTDASGNEVSVVQPVENEPFYTFTMPASDVAVKSVFNDDGEYYNEDGSLKPGKYKAYADFGKYADKDGKVTGAMGASAYRTDIEFTVLPSGKIHIDEYKTPAIRNPLGFIGLGETKVSKHQPITADGGAHGSNGGKANGYALKDEDYPVLLGVENTKSWCNIVLETGERSPFIGEVELAAIEAGSGLAGAAGTAGNVWVEKGSNEFHQVFPDVLEFDLPDTVSIKNTDMACQRSIYTAVYAMQMGYYPQMTTVIDFTFFDKIGDVEVEEEYSLAPVISPNGGDFTDSVEVTITAGDGAKIYYSTDMSDPTAESTEYKAPITLTEDTVIKAIAIEDGKEPSTVASAAFTKKTSQSGGGEDGKTVPDGKYKIPVKMMNSANPERTSMGNGALVQEAEVTVKDGKATYTLELKGITVYSIYGHLLKMWQYAEDDTNLENPIEATVASTYTDKGMDGNDATFPKTVTIPREKDHENQFYIQIRSDAMKAGDTYFEPDALLVFDWSSVLGDDPVQEKSAKPAFIPDGGSFTGSRSVTISAANGASIYYTLDGTNPTENSAKYANAINLTATTTVKAIAVEENKTASDVASATFTKSSSSSGGGGGGGGGSSTKTFFLTDGRYLVDVDLWNAYTNKASMGNVALQSNKQALVTVSNGKVTTVEIATNPVQVGTVHSAITAMKYANSQSVSDSNSLSGVNVLETGDITTSGHTTSGTYKYIKRASFTLPSSCQPTSSSDVTYVAVNFTVPDTPMDEVVAGSGKGLEARLKLTWSTAEKTAKSSLSANDEVARGTSSTTGQTVKDIALTDSVTKIKLNADTEALPENTKLSVKKVTSGTTFESAQKAMENETKPWELYEIKAASDNADVQPKGQVQLSIPCTDAGLTVYRINDNGTRVAIKGEVKDGAYVFRTSALGNFAVMSNAEDGPIVPIVTESTADNTGNKADSLKDIVGHWAEKNIKKVVEKGLFSGTSETEFSPNKEMTRGMFITVLGRLHGVTGYSGETKFKDVKADKYYAPYINWGNANGIVSGLSADEFAPDAPITRQEMATFLVRYAKFANIELNSGEPVSFKDAGSIAAWAKDAVNAVSAAKLISGYPDGTFHPTGKATRAEVATLLINFVESYGL